MMPLSFTRKEGGNYERWNFGQVDMLRMNQRVNVDNEELYINGVQVFGFFFEDAPGSKTGRRWNCKFGWEKKGML